MPNNSSPSSAPHVELRLSEVETHVALVQRDVSSLKEGQNLLGEQLSSFVTEWRTSKDKEMKDIAGRKVGPFQIFAMIGVTVTVTATVIGGGMALVETKVEALRQSSRGAETIIRGEIQSQSAQTALQLRGQQDNMTATQTALQALQRDMSAMAVKIGLVEQVSKHNFDGLKAMEGYDAHLARQEERTRSLQEEVKAMGHRLSK